MAGFTVGFGSLTELTLPWRLTMTFARIALLVTVGTLLLEGCSPGVGAADAAGNRTSFSAVINGKPIKGDRVMALGTNSAGITPDGSEYTPRHLVVSITSLTADRIIGTFSGTLEFSFQTPDPVRKLAPPVIRVENGQFDIPIVRQ
jgi:hypothetical protein